MPTYKIVTNGPAMVESEYTVVADSEEQALELAKNGIVPEVKDIYWEGPEHADLEWEDYKITEVP